MSETKPPALLPTREDREAADRLIAALERENLSHSGRDLMAETLAAYRLRHIPAPDKGEGIEEAARRLLYDACDYCGVTRPPGHMLLAPFNEESGPWQAAIQAVMCALATATPPEGDKK